MKNPCKQALIAAAMSVAIAIPQLASAEATTITGTGTIAADARVDFRVVIPGVLRFRVGSAAGIDQIVFAPTSTEMLAGTDVVATAVSGDLGNGAVTVDIVSNTGQIIITQDSNAASLIGAANNMPFTEILTASNDVTNLPAPVLGTNDSSQPTLTGNLTNESATWTYTYDNTIAYNSDVYDGRVTYTATSP